MNKTIHTNFLWYTVYPSSKSRYSWSNVYRIVGVKRISFMFKEQKKVSYWHNNKIIQSK